MESGKRPQRALRASKRLAQTWPWAAGSILIPLAIIAGTLVGARYAARARLAAQVTAAPALPPLRVVNVVQPPTGVMQWALARNGQRSVVVALAATTLPGCLPQRPCAGPHLANQVALYGVGASYPEQLAIQAMAPTDLGQCETLAGASLPTAYLVCRGAVQRVALDTGQMSLAFSLPNDLPNPRAALDGATRTLYIASGQTLTAFDLATGAQTGQQTFHGPLSAPVVDTGLGRVYVVVNGGASQPLLMALNAHALTPLGGEALPAGWSAGPCDNGSDHLYLYGQDGAIGAVDLGALGLAPAAPYPAAQVTPVAALRGARALGWDSANRAIIALYADHLTAYDAESLRAYAWAPVSGAWDAERPLAVDSDHGVLYAPDGSGAIVALSLARPAGPGAPDAATAIMLARAGLGKLLPDTRQSPPFLDAQTLPLTTTGVARAYAIHYTDLGWRGPYAGHARVVAVTVGKQAGDYRVTFAVDWNQLFVHTHTWTVELLTDGRVRMVSDTGDAIP